MKSLLLLASLIAAATLAAWWHASSSGSSADASSRAIAGYVAAEDNDFVTLQGALQASNRSSAYYNALLTLPGAASCVVYVYGAARDRFGGCRFNAKNLDDATVLYHAWLDRVRTALPQWKRSNVARPPNGDVAATIFTDASQIHGVFVDIFGNSESGYRVTTTFAKMSVLRS